MSEPLDESARVAAALESEREQERALLHAAETLSRLTNLSEFEFLRAEVEKKRGRMAETLAARVMAGEDLSVLQRQIDHDRGFILGMMYPFEVALGAARKLAEYDEKRQTEPEGAEMDGWSLHGS